MKVIIDTTTGTKEISGEHLEVKPVSGAVRILRNGTQVAAFRNWENWQIIDDKED